ncbi:hypothetical protein PV350_03215 [Streptomyces sp. PA03-6a]|nr:hypothetical protein [Streptomyces sp. PA03-6a]
MDDAHSTVYRAEFLRRYTALPVEFTERPDRPTAFMELRRAVVAAEFAQEIEALYVTS